MRNFLNDKKINTSFLLISLIFFVFINLIYFYSNFQIKMSDYIYSLHELFINYQAGFIRRGLLGEIAWQLNNFFSIEPKFFFNIFFFIIHLLQILLFFLLFRKYIVSKLIFFLIFFSPSLLLFHIYSPELYFLKDALIKTIFLAHAFIFCKFYLIDKDKNKYLKCLKILIIPLLLFSILIHEYQVFSVSLHFLITLSVVKTKDEIKKILKYYLFPIIPILLVIIFFGNQAQFEDLSNLLMKFNVKLNPYLGGGLYHYIGGFYKWHFFYFGYRDFVNLLLSFVLSVLVFYVLFQYLIEKRIIKFHTKYQSYYLYFFIPAIIPFLLTVDHGRNLGFISMYLVTFYSTLNFDKIKFTKQLNIICQNILFKSLIFIFIFFYIFMWKLDQFAGFGLEGEPNDIFQSSLFAEFIKLIKFLYMYIDHNIIKLPEIRL
jgi:hypothetical protein